MLISQELGEKNNTPKISKWVKKALYVLLCVKKVKKLT